jgi:magnesium transporter
MRVGHLLGPDVKEILREDPELVRELLEEIHPEDIADLIAELDADEAAALLERMPVEDAADIFERLEDDEQGELAVMMPPESVAQIASEMAADDRADLFSLLPESIGDQVFEKLEKVDQAAAQEVRDIEKWPETSAAHLMTTEYVTVAPDVTVEAAIEAVRREALLANDAPLYNVYAVSGDKRLAGIASLRQLIASIPSERLADIMRTNIISVPPETDQEDVARRMAKYDLNAMPVIDDRGEILGIITIDDVMDVLVAEQTEDVQKIGAVAPLDVSYFKTSFFQLVQKRVVWLIILFIGGFFTETALRHFDPVFRAVVGASYYVPLLISAGGNSGSQSSTLVIRGLAVGEIRLGHWWKILVREFVMGLVLGTILGTIGFIRVLTIGHMGPLFAMAVGFTLIGICTTGCTVGSMLPIGLKRIGLDPATSSTPFIASLVDVCGIIVFVQVAKIVFASVIAAHESGMHP